MDPEGIEQLSLNDIVPSSVAVDCSVPDENECSVAPSSLHLDIRCRYPFFSDVETLSYIKKSKVMFIMRGLPGSGKSSLVKQLALLYPEIVICSTDDFFRNEDGTYFRDADKLSAAHEFCRTKAVQAISDRKLHLVIDNTNIRAWEMNPYITLAHQSGYTVLLVVPCTSWAFDPVKLAQFNIHKVPIEHIQLKLGKFEEVFPYYWGWFLNDDDSKELRTMAIEYFDECVRWIPEFSDYLPVIEYDANHSFNDIYSNRSTQLHCTSFYVGRKNRNERVVSYAHSKAVTDSIGKVSKLMITGIVYTPRTAGLRVALAEHQVDLFVASDDDSTTAVGDWTNEDVSVKRQHKGKKARKGRSKSSPQVVDGDVENHQSNNSLRNARAKNSSPKTGKVNASCSSAGNESELAESPVCVKSDLGQVCRGVSRKAHVTLGYSNTSQASQTGRDILDVVAFESQRRSLDIDKITLDDNQACIGYYGKGKCVVTFRQPLCVNALFSGHYC